MPHDEASGNCVRPPLMKIEQRNVALGQARLFAFPGELTLLAEKWCRLRDPAGKGRPP